MINFGSSPSKYSLYAASTDTNWCRANRPPIKLRPKPKSDGSRTPPVKAAVQQPPRRKTSTAKSAGRCQPKNRLALHPPSPPDSTCPFDRHPSPQTWDLIPLPAEKLFPNWDHSELTAPLPSTLTRCSQRTLHELTKAELLSNMPPSQLPQPREIAIMNLIQGKLAKWEKEEEELFQKEKGWYCQDAGVEDRAWRSWLLTQNRDFGSAVWRWLRLQDWNSCQTTRMKGLYSPLWREKLR